MSELREVFEMTTRQMHPDQDAWREQEKRQRRANRNKKIGAFAVAAAIGVVAVAAILRPNATTPPKEPGVNPADATAEEEVATNFLEAYGDLDADQAIAYLADEADIPGLVASLGAQGMEGTPEELPLLISMLEAMGYEQMLDSCGETGGSASATNVRCPFGFHLLGSDELGRDPFRGSYFDLTVRDRAIVRASAYWETAEFSPRMWEPFANWVSSNYPEDAAVMYEDLTYSGAQLSEESIRLWKQRIGDYLNEVGSIESSPIGRVSRTVDGVPFSFRVPTAGWAQFGTISINKSIVGAQGAEAIIFWAGIPDDDYADPCASLLGQPVGPTAADLAATVSTARGTELVAGPSDVAVGEHPAKHVVLTVREDVGCDPGYFYTWLDRQGGPLWPETRVGDTIRVWIVDVDGTLLFIEAETNEQANSALEQEIQEIVGSIRFD